MKNRYQPVTKDISGQKKFPPSPLSTRAHVREYMSRRHPHHAHHPFFLQFLRINRQRKFFSNHYHRLWSTTVS